jgi:hypothetical protein
MGARPIKRAVESLIAQPLAKAILEGRVDQGAELIACATKGVVALNPSREPRANQVRMWLEALMEATVSRVGAGG